MENVDEKKEMLPQEAQLEVQLVYWIPDENHLPIPKYNGHNQ